MSERALDDLLRTVPVPAKIEHIAALSGGTVSHKWLLQTAAGALVLRADTALADVLGLNRQRELQAMALAPGLAPEVVWADAGKGVLLMRYVAGDVLGPSALRLPPQAGRVGGLLADLHSRPGDSGGCPVVDYAAAAQRYAMMLGGQEAMGMAAEVAVLAARWCADKSRYALCHHDLSVGNIVDPGNGLPFRLIDWEYAGCGEPCMDLAAILGPENASDESAAALLDGYGGAPEAERLAGCRRLYECLSVLWLMLVCGRTRAPASYRQALAALRTGLGR